MIYNFLNREEKDPPLREVFKLARELIKEELKDIKKVIFNSIIRKKK